MSNAVRNVALDLTRIDVTELAEILYESGAETESVRAATDKLWNRFGAIADRLAELARPQPPRGLWELLGRGRRLLAARHAAPGGGGGRARSR